jgi:hypothetical protein
MEIIVSLTILSVTMAGLLNVFISAKKHSFRSRSRVSAGELGKYFLDPLHMQVRQDQWGSSSNCLSSNPTCPSCCPSAQTISNITYTPAYNITNVVGTGTVGDCVANDCLRRVKVDITWTTH